MKYVNNNIVSICFLVLAGFLAYLNKDGFGWCIFGALITFKTTKTIITKK